MSRLLLIIDIQNDYFPGGAFPLVEPEAAAGRAAELLAAFRAAGDPVIHVQHVWDGADATFMRPGTAGVEIHELVAPQEGEPVVQKASPNSFLDTDLLERLCAFEPDQLVVVGMMSSMCVDSTVRAAADLDFTVTVAHDACAAPDLEFDGAVIPAAQVHGSFMAALADSYASVTTVSELLAR
ncbi:cysteine hydrolase family protein [Leifsonia sp. Leaf264]|uniref:cysteine hydrolase family protein n=1 Tax=Leifsonia sp. Leaf264 TaxID=1736314 RepID=UPI0006F76181|nr:cysteine hydrolase family protein [Leifsonia sp. Leaf264]KQO96842.1 Isochorismatase [Leifsonia sp. Leaf264]